MFLSAWARNPSDFLGKDSNIINCSSFQRSCWTNPQIHTRSWCCSQSVYNETLVGKTINTVSFRPLSLLFFLKDSQILHILKVVKYFDMWDICHGDEGEAPTGGSQSAPQGCFHCWSYFGPSSDLVPHRCPCVTRASLHPDSEWGSEDILHQTAVHHWS